MRLLGACDPRNDNKRTRYPFLRLASSKPGSSRPARIQLALIFPPPPVGALQPPPEEEAGVRGGIGVAGTSVSVDGGGIVRGTTVGAGGGVVPGAAVAAGGGAAPGIAVAAGGGVVRGTAVGAGEPPSIFTTNASMPPKRGWSKIGVAV